MKRTLAVLAALVALPLVARAQKPVTDTDAIELTTKIEAIDKTSRLVTLRDKDGESETIYCGPEVKRFDELKVGDTITVRYYESIAYAIRKPGQPSGLPAATGPKITRGQGARPSGPRSSPSTSRSAPRRRTSSAPCATSRPTAAW